MPLHCLHGRSQAGGIEAEMIINIYIAPIIRSPVNVEMHLLDLPDEMLLSVFSQCTAVDMLSTFIGIHPRLDRIVCDPMLVRHLDFTAKTWQDEIASISDQVLVDDFTVILNNRLWLRRHYR